MKWFVLIETDGAVRAGNDDRFVIERVAEEVLQAHVLGYVDDCCKPFVDEATAWIKGAEVGDWLDAHHLDDEIYVCVADG